MTLREWWSRMRGTLRRDDALEREMSSEMQFHLDMAARRQMDRGLLSRDRPAGFSAGQTNAARYRLKMALMAAPVLPSDFPMARTSIVMPTAQCRNIPGTKLPARRAR